MAVNQWIEQLARFGYAAKGFSLLYYRLAGDAGGVGFGSKRLKRVVSSNNSYAAVGKIFLSVVAVGLIACSGVSLKHS